MAPFLLELSKSTYRLQNYYHFPFIVIYNAIKTKSPQDVTTEAFDSLSWMTTQDNAVVIYFKKAAGSSTVFNLYTLNILFLFL